MLFWILQIHADKKFIVDQHVKSAKHQLNVRKLQRGEPSQQTIQHCLEEKPKNSEQAQFNEDLCKAFIGANIPLKKLNNPNLSSFLTKYCKFNIPDESTVRKGSVDVIYKQTINDIKKKVGENYFYLVVDETTDSCGRYIAHALIGVLGETNDYGRSYLIASKQLEKTNNLSVTRFVQETLTNFFLPDRVPSEKFILLLSDAAPYMVKAAQNLKIFYSNLFHVTCLAHGINRVAECIRDQFPLVNDLINQAKKVFLKAPSRVQFYKENCPNTQLPPQPVITRWGTWLAAAIFYAENYELVKKVIEDLNDSSSAALINAKTLFSNPTVKENLIFIKTNYSFVPIALTKLEATSVSLTDSVALINQFEVDCKKVSGTVGAAVIKKFMSVIENNTGFKILKNISEVFIGNFTNFERELDLYKLETHLIPKLKYCPITSVDVERSFSIFKHMFTDKRHNFLLENFEKHLVINCFYNCKE